MSFVTGLALAVGLLVGLPLLAHLLRRGKTQEFEFPAARLVPEQAVTSRQRTRLEDRALLSVRALTILALAMLGATPLAQCSRLSVQRQAGASVALAIVLDDSQSMQARVREGRRWDLALAGARQLLASTRPGDAVALIAAGKPARVALSPTSDLGAVTQALSQLQVSDRATDLDGAVRLASSLVGPLAQPDKRVVVLSDLADKPWSEPGIAVSAPLANLREPISDCALTGAEQQGRTVNLTVACSSETAARERKVELLRTSDSSEAKADAGAKSGAQGGTQQSIALPARAGIHILQLPMNDPALAHEVQLVGDDDNPDDDRAVVVPQTSAFAVAVVADPAKAAVITGGATVVEQALNALDDQIAVRPLSLMPQSESELAPFAALIVDDPPGLSPEARSALTTWLQRGGVAIGLLGPGAQSVQLSSSLEPFARGGSWERLNDPMAASDDATASWLAGDGEDLADLTRRGRVRLDGAQWAGSSVALRWSDGVPLILERAIDSGVVLTVGLPASVEISDLPLRPLFLGLLEHALSLARVRRGPSQSLVGVAWSFPADARVEIRDPRGVLREARGLGLQAPSGSADAAQLSFAPDLSGRYRVEVDSRPQNRIVTLDPQEVVAAPVPPPAEERGETSSVQSQVDISREVALTLLLLLTLELAVRLLAPRWLRRRSLARVPS